MLEIMMVSTEHFLISLDKYIIMKDHTSIIRVVNKPSILRQYSRLKYYLK